MFSIVLNERQVIMRIRLGIAMTRKVLDRRQNAAILHSTHIMERFFKNFVSIFSKRPKINDGIIAIAIDINRRSEIDMHPQPFAMLGHFLAHVVDAVIIALNCSKRHLIGEFNCRIKPHTEPPFTINGH